jgi:hypothetical protein
MVAIRGFRAVQLPSFYRLVRTPWRAPTRIRIKPYLGGLCMARAARMAWARASNSLAAAPRFMSRRRVGRDQPTLNTHPACPARAPYSSRGQRPRKTDRKSADPVGVAWTRTEAPSTVAGSLSCDPFRVGPAGVAPFRGRCPPLLYPSPSGIGAV